MIVIIFYYKREKSKEILESEYVSEIIIFDYFLRCIWR